MDAKKLIVIALIATLVISGCSGATNREKGTAVGAAGGAAIGAAVSKGSVWGVLIGAAVGGAAGNLIGKHMDEQAKELTQAVPTAEVERVGEGINMTFDSSLMFETGSATLGTTSKQDLAAAAEVFNKYEDTNLLIEGHTDNTGTDDVNIPLSEQRAKSVSSYLKSQGVAGSRLQEKWYGSSQPKYPNDTAENRAKNRRVEIAIWANDDMKAEAEAQAGSF